MARRFGMKRIFSLFLVSYLIVLIMPAVLAGYLYQQSMSASREKYLEREQGRLARSAAYFERYLEQLDSTVLKLAYDADLQQILKMDKPAPEEKSVMQIVRFYERTRDILSTGQDSSYALILKNNEFIFTNTGVTYGIFFFFDHIRHYEGLSAAEWIDESFSSTHRDFIPMQQIFWNGTSVKAMTYNRPVRGYGRQVVGTIQYLITEEEMNAFFQDPLEEEGQVRLYNREGRLLAAIGEDPSVRESVSDFKGDRGYVEGEDTVTLYKRSDEGLLFTLSRPKSVAFSDAYRLGRIGAISASLCVLLELGLDIFFAWRYSKPLRNMLTNLRQMLGSDTMGNQNEYHQLTSGMQLLIQANHTMRSVLRDQKEREKRSVMDKLMKGSFSSEDEALMAAEHAGILLGDEPRCVVVWETEAETLQSIVTDGQESCVKWLYDEMPGRYVLMAETGNRAALDDLLRRIQTASVGYAGVGRAYTRSRDLTLSYQQAVYSLRKARGEEIRMFRYEDLPVQSQEFYYPEELEHKLIQGTTHGEFGVVEAVFHALMRENAEKRFLSETLRRILQGGLAASYLQVLQDWPIMEQETPEQIMESSETTDEMLERMRRRFLSLCGAIGRMRAEQKTDVGRHLVEYLEEHFGDSQLGVVSMAEVFGFSETYFSQFFRETTGESFSNSLERIRMDHAKQYLLEGILDVEAIAAKCGYTNAGSFRRAFKRVHGVSPSVWKQENQ